MEISKFKDCITILFHDGVITSSEFLASCGHSDERIRQALKPNKKNSRRSKNENK